MRDILKVCVGIPIVALTVINLKTVFILIWVALGLCVAYTLGDLIFKGVTRCVSSVRS